MLELQPSSGTGEIRHDLSIARSWRAVEQHVLDAHMVMKPFQMTQARRSAGDMQMQRRRAVAGKIGMKGIAERGGLQESRVAAAARCIGLLHVDHTVLQQKTNKNRRVG